MKQSILLVAVLAIIAPSVSPAPRAQDVPDDVAGLVALLKERRDSADAYLIRRLANKKTREAMEGLLEVYGGMGSIYMRRAVCQGLALYDSVDGAEQPALQKLMDVATESIERELRKAAVDLIADCDNFGKAFLKMIVESSADDEVRERAMRHHTGRPRPEDLSWYREIYDPTSEEKAKKQTKKAKGEEHKVPHRLQPLRELAFEVLAGELEIEKLIAAAKDTNKKIRALAMAELDSRGDDTAFDVADEIYDKAGEPSPTRLVAARILAREEGAKIANRFIKDATRRGTPREFALGIADILAGMKDPGIDKTILKQVGKGKGYLKLFYLRAAKNIEDPKLDKALIKLIKDKEPEIQREVMGIVAERRLKEALPELEKAIQKGRDPLVLSACLKAISALRRNDVEWEQRLVEYARHEDVDIRNASVEQLGLTKNPDYLGVLVELLDHDLWSTRLAAAKALGHMRLAQGVGPLCMRIGEEEGRMLHEMADILFRLTGKTFRTSGAAWKRWWGDEGAEFEVPSSSQIQRLEEEEEVRRLKQITRTTFFGIRVLSHRVTFIIDVSGSMNESTRGEYVGEQGRPRIEVAKAELVKALDGIDHESLFNIITFSSDVNAWQDKISENTPEIMADAKSFVERLGANGGTNVYGALRFAFEDPDVDTIFVMSDGEPTVGDVTDATIIREAVTVWNENRGVVIHCVAVGGSLQLLEWLAEDAGGSYVDYP